MKEHTFWFWFYWGCWLAGSLINISVNAAGKDPARLLGNVIGMIIFGCIIYYTLKWIYDYKMSRTK